MFVAQEAWEASPNLYAATLSFLVPTGRGRFVFPPKPTARFLLSGYEAHLRREPGTRRAWVVARYARAGSLSALREPSLCASWREARWCAALTRARNVARLVLQLAVS